MIMYPEIETDANLNLSQDIRHVIQQAFPDYQRIVIKQELGGGFSGSRIFIAHPIKSGASELSVVVKLGSTAMVQREWLAYQEHIQDKVYRAAQVKRVVLPANSAWGALLYPLVGGEMFKVQTLDDYCRQENARTEDIRSVVNDLIKLLDQIASANTPFPEFHWQPGYDHILPHNLTIEHKPVPPGVTPLRIGADGLPDSPPAQGDFVRLEGFVLVKVDLQKHVATLNLPRDVARTSWYIYVQSWPAAGQYQIDECIDSLEGQVIQTRDSYLYEQAAKILGQDPNSVDKTIHSPEGICLSNPLPALAGILNQRRNVKVANIHGDMNLKNILIEGDRYLHLIDFAEARQDHVLHDLLCLERAVLTELIPELVARHNLALVPTLCDLFAQLHAEGFQDTSVARIPDLAKPYEILVQIRKLAARYLNHVQDYAEYYQGLFLYLLGALKFGSLDKVPEAPLPKQTAFWGAAIMLHLLDSSLKCPRAACHPNRDAQHAGASLVELEPEVKVIRRGSDYLQPATLGMHLHCGDRVSVYEDASAKVHCHNGQIVAIKANKNWQVDCQNPRNHIIARLTHQVSRQLSHLSSIFSFSVNLPADQISADVRSSAPILLSPRNTAIRQARPDFYWQPISGAAGYRLSVKTTDGQTWHRETRATHLAYPQNAPSLGSEGVNTVRLEAMDVALPPDLGIFWLLDRAELDQIAQAEAEIQSLPLGRSAKTFLMAQVYGRWNLRSDAIQLLEDLIRSESSVASDVWLQLGNLYLETALYAQAESAYQHALSTATAIDHDHSRAVALIGLAWSCYMQNQDQKALRHALAIPPEYAQAAELLRKQIGMSTFTGTISLFGYARFLAEKVAPQLADEIHKISEAFMERLMSWPTLNLKRGFVPAQLGQGDDIKAMEILAISCVTTDVLRKTLSPAEIENQVLDGRFMHTLRNQAEQVARETIGLDAEQARDFAQVYAEWVAQEPNVLQALTEQ